MAPAQPFPLTTFELLALLSLRDGPSARQSAASLRITDLAAATGADFRRAGLASLLARDLASVADGKITARGHAGGVAGALTSAVRWVELGVVRKVSTDAAILLGGGTGALLITPRGFDVWNFLPLQESRDLADVAVDLLRRGITGATPQDAVAATLKSLRLDGEDVTGRSASIRRDADGGWQIASGSAEASGTLTLAEGTLPDVDAALAALRGAVG